ncbi:hypothetical protein G7046_g6999 [Stylonectria norvegica]|nr:hypothetical protein G7046_g6999 [Stylonectria norvegica]
MPPPVIADSDDEEGTYSPPQSPQAPGAVAERDVRTATGSSDHVTDHVSHATNSTDPAFFQDIYDEQNDAARQHVPGASLEAASRDRLSSSEVTAPAPFQRTVTGLIEPSSLTSITDPAATKEKTSSGKGMSDWTQISTPGRKKAPTANMEDVWDVPSSPEEVLRRPRIPKIILKRSKVQPATDSATKSKKSLKTISSRSQGQEGIPASIIEIAEDGDDKSPVRRRKRRKIDPSPLSQQGLNDVTLVTIPFTDEKEAAGQEPLAPESSNDLPGTLPLDAETSFMFLTKPFTNSQKMQYQSLQLAAVDGHSQDMLLPLSHFNARVERSSGTATNMNTPRSELDLHYTSTAPQPPDATPSIRIKVVRSSGRQRVSSPDAISTVNPPARQTETSQRGKSRRRASTDSNGDEFLGRKDEPSENEHQPRDLQVIDDESDYAPESVKEKKPDALQMIDDESDYAPKPVKGKKPRGRPKKTSESTKASAPRPELLEEVEPTTKQKKKRGRPRKADIAATTQTTPQIETVSCESPKHAEVADRAVEGQDEPGTEAEASETCELNGAPAENHDESGGDPTTEAGSDLGLPATALAEVSQNDAAAPADSSEAKVVSDAERDLRGVAANAVEAKKSSSKSKGSSSTGTTTSRPLYRVGLSKRSRIAPLLKSLRK